MTKSRKRYVWMAVFSDGTPYLNTACYTRKDSKRMLIAIHEAIWGMAALRQEKYKIKKFELKECGK